MSANHSTLSREEIRAIFRRHVGSQLEIARELNIRAGGVTSWLKNQMSSARIAEAAERKARKLLELEKRQAAGSSSASSPGAKQQQQPKKSAQPAA